MMSQESATFLEGWQTSQPRRQREIEAGVPFPLKNANTIAHKPRTAALSERRHESRMIPSNKRPSSGDKLTATLPPNPDASFTRATSASSSRAARALLLVLRASHGDTATTRSRPRATARKDASTRNLNPRQEPMSSAPLRSPSPSRRHAFHPLPGVPGSEKVDEIQSRTPVLSNQPLNKATSRTLENQASKIYTGISNPKASEAAMRNLAATASKFASQDERPGSVFSDAAASLTKSRHHGRITLDQIRENREPHPYAVATAHPIGISLNIGIPCIISVGPKRPRSRASIKYIGHISSVSSHFGLAASSCVAALTVQATGVWLGVEISNYDRFTTSVIRASIEDMHRCFGPPTTMRELPQQSSKNSAPKRRPDHFEGNDGLSTSRESRNVRSTMRDEAELHNAELVPRRTRVHGFTNPVFAFVRPSQVIHVINAD